MSMFPPSDPIGRAVEEFIRNHHNPIVAKKNAEIERYRLALQRIMEVDGMGADLSPAGPCYEIACKALNKNPAPPAQS